MTPQAHRVSLRRAARLWRMTVDLQFKVGDIVIDREGGMRMKIAAIDKNDGTVRCTWTRGPAKHSRSRSEEHTSELQSLMRISYAVFCLKKKTTNPQRTHSSKYSTNHN